MSGGYVLDYSDNKFAEFFKHHNIDIHSAKYRDYGTSKAKKLRSFWEQESDPLVAKVLSELLDAYEADCDLNGKPVDKPILEKSRSIVERLSGGTSVKPPESIDEFLHQEFSVPNVQKLPIEPAIVPIIESRLDEARKALSVSAYLAVVVLCGSVLEAVLLGKAQQAPSLFNASKASPKDDKGKVRRFHEWSLASFIDVATEVGVLKQDVQKFSHGLRDFRNYIHPYQQLASGFTPDEHTAKVCFQVLKAALASVAGER